MSASNGDPVKVFVGYFTDVVAPLATYYIFHALGIPPVVGTIACGLVAVASTARNTWQQKRIDKFGLLVIIEIAVSLGLLFMGGDVRILMAKPAILFEIGGVYIFANSLRGKPINYSGVRSMATRSNPSRGEPFDETWEASHSFRATMRFMAFVWAFAFMIDGALRVYVVYSVSIDKVALLSNGPHIVILSLLIAASALSGKRMGALVDEHIALKAKSESHI